MDIDGILLGLRARSLRTASGFWTGGSLLVAASLRRLCLPCVPGKLWRNYPIRFCTPLQIA